MGYYIRSRYLFREWKQNSIVFTFIIRADHSCGSSIIISILDLLYLQPGSIISIINWTSNTGFIIIKFWNSYSVKADTIDGFSAAVIYLWYFYEGDLLLSFFWIIYWVDGLLISTTAIMNLVECWFIFNKKYCSFSLTVFFILEDICENSKYWVLWGGVVRDTIRGNTWAYI